jgi:hypothetical protein
LSGVLAWGLLTVVAPEVEKSRSMRLVWLLVDLGDGVLRDTGPPGRVFQSRAVEQRYADPFGDVAADCAPARAAQRSDVTSGARLLSVTGTSRR